VVIGPSSILFASLGDTIVLSNLSTPTNSKVYTFTIGDNKPSSSRAKGKQIQNVTFDIEVGGRQRKFHRTDLSAYAGFVLRGEQAAHGIYVSGDIVSASYRLNHY